MVLRFKFRSPALTLRVTAHPETELKLTWEPLVITFKINYNMVQWNKQGRELASSSHIFLWEFCITYWTIFICPPSTLPRSTPPLYAVKMFLGVNPPPWSMVDLPGITHLNLTLLSCQLLTATSGASCPPSCFHPWILLVLSLCGVSACYYNCYKFMHATTLFCQKNN